MMILESAVVLKKALTDLHRVCISTFPLFWELVNPLSAVKQMLFEEKLPVVLDHDY